MSKYYIARNKDNTLEAFQNKPAKHGWNFWDAVDDYGTKLKENWFPEVKWTDKEPKVLTIEESPWIKVEDGLPNRGDTILVMYRHDMSGKIFYTPIIHYNYNDIRYVIMGLDDFSVIAWMPIPEFKE